MNNTDTPKWVIAKAVREVLHRNLPKESLVIAYKQVTGDIEVRDVAGTELQTVVRVAGIGNGPRYFVVKVSEQL